MQSIPDDLWWTYWSESAQTLRNTCSTGRRVFPFVLRFNGHLNAQYRHTPCEAFIQKDNQYLLLTVGSTRIDFFFTNGFRHDAQNLKDLIIYNTPDSIYHCFANTDPTKHVFLNGYNLLNLKSGLSPDLVQRVLVSVAPFLMVKI